MRVRCTASSLIVRTLPGGADHGQRLVKGQVVVAVGASFDGAWYYISSPAVSGWAARQFLEEVTAEGQHERWVGCAAGNFRKGRVGNPRIDMVVIHVIEGTLASADAWFNNPESGVSAHYGIGKSREVHQYVREEDTAYHAGRVQHATSALVLQRGTNPNSFSVGIEHEGTADSIWPDTLYEDSAQLVAAIARRHGIPLDRTHIVGHHEIYAPKSCPGKGDVDRIVRMARALNKEQ